MWPGHDITCCDVNASSIQVSLIVKELTNCLRCQVEVGVLVLQEGLEEKGLAREDIDAQVAAHRSKLVAEVDAALAKAASPKASRSSRCGPNLAP